MEVGKVADAAFAHHPPSPHEPAASAEVQTKGPKPHRRVITTACPGVSASARSPSLTSTVPAAVMLSTVTFASRTDLTPIQSTGSSHALRAQASRL